MQRDNKSAVKRPLSFWLDFIGLTGKGEKGKKGLLLLFMLLLGIILMFAGPLISARPKTEKARVIQELPSLTQEQGYEADLGRALEEILEHIDGISNVRVFITFYSSIEGIYARTYEESKRNTLEQDREGGTREIVDSSRREEQVLLRDGGGGEKALLLKEKMPEVKGVIVVAKGAENSYLRLEVVRAVQSVLKLPVHRIAFLPYGS